jgi:acetyl esterase/lipase
MSETHDMAKRTVVYQLPSMDTVTLQQDVEYQTTEAGPLTLDLYSPAESKSGEKKRPAVVFVSGYPDPGGRLKKMGTYTSWGRLVAASGAVAVTCTNREPVADLRTLLRYLRQNAASLGIDESRIGLWAASGNVPVALSVLAQEDLRCAALCYGYMLDLGESTHVAAAASQFGFVHPGTPKSVGEIRLPLLLVRAGQDQLPHLNETIDRFVAEALAHNLPLTLINHVAAPHAFDILDDSEATREVIRGILGFLRFHLRV